ncbi:MAG: SIS domain-containing protein, partial [Acidobacteriota bacterium]|nr:SIS domain-containing protein [Acidobacteriota bacterium]
MSTPLLENILNQANALQAIGDYQFGPGHSSLDEAASILRSKKRIVLSGMGASFFACIPFQYQLAEQGLEVIAIETAELLYFKPTAMDKDTVVVLVSRSGESVEVTKLISV